MRGNGQCESGFVCNGTILRMMVCRVFYEVYIEQNRWTESKMYCEQGEVMWSQELFNKQICKR